MRANELDDLLKKIDTDITEEKEKANYLFFLKNNSDDEEVVGSDEYLEAINKLRGDSSLLKVSSGFDYLDRITEGFWEGNVIVVSGPTKEGKTTFCQSLTINFIKQGIECLWFPFDTPGDELISRFQTPIKFFLPKKNPSQKKLDWIEKKIVEGIAKYNTRVVFIDHLAMLTRANDNERNYATELQSIMMELKQIAIRWRVIIFVNHHIKKIDSNVSPMLSDLKDSSGVAQDSDMVIMIWRKKERKAGVIENSSKAILQVQANRRTGKTGKMTLEHKGDHFEQESSSTAPLGVNISEL